jgi:hypothetical protein
MNQHTTEIRQIVESTHRKPLPNQPFDDFTPPYETIRHRHRHWKRQGREICLGNRLDIYQGVVKEI